MNSYCEIIGSGDAQIERNFEFVKVSTVMGGRNNEMLRFYEDQHKNPANRWVHHAAHLMAVVGMFGLFIHPLIGSGMILMALPLSWFGHFAFERNAPAFFDNTDRGGLEGGVRKKITIALGGIVWSAACFGRVFGLGPLARFPKN